ncbi:MAG: phenylacetate--CoA ligase family protein [Acidobacteria bacterium]|nr:phenylacetate--CoA ligase family protein [Acidobacteriota bacterium]
MPYYIELFNQIGFDAEAPFTFSDYAKLPILTREIIQENKESMLNVRFPRDTLLKDSTGGSTGIPTNIYLSPNERGWKESGAEYFLQKVGVRRGSRIAYFWGHHLDPNGTDGFYSKLRSRLLNEKWFDCFRLGPEMLTRYHKEFTQWNPDCIIAYSSALSSLAEFLSEEDVNANEYPNICFITGAEKLYERDREIIEKVFNRPVYERYGGRDFGGLAMQTSASRDCGFEVDWAWALVEPRTTEQESPILVTKLHSDGMPMLRYDNGDLGRFAPNSCPGEPSYVIEEIIGRTLDRIYLPSGKWVLGAEFPHMLKDFPIREFMIVQDENYRVEAKIVPAQNFTDNDSDRIRQVMEANLVDIPVFVSLVEHIERTKANKRRPVISKIKH